jgi:energy-coupling factor transport system permease protein
LKARITYRPGRSFLHRLHPLAKVAWLLFGTVFVFVAQSPWLVLAALVLIGTLFLAIRPGRLPGVRLFASTALLLAILQIVFEHRGEELARIGPLMVTSGGIEAGVYVAARFLSVVLLSYLFVLTTSPNDLAYALMQCGLPYRYGFTLVTALRLVPVFENEASIVYQAQLARGVAYDRRSLGRIVLLARQFFLPLLVSALAKVDALAVSMEGRCFGKYPTRTFLREIRPTWWDVLAGGVLIIAVGATVTLLVLHPAF